MEEKRPQVKVDDDDADDDDDVDDDVDEIDDDDHDGVRKKYPRFKVDKEVLVADVDVSLPPFG